MIEIWFSSLILPLIKQNINFFLWYKYTCKKISFFMNKLLCPVVATCQTRESKISGLLLPCTREEGILAYFRVCICQSNVSKIKKKKKRSLFLVCFQLLCWEIVRKIPNLTVLQIKSGNIICAYGKEWFPILICIFKTKVKSLPLGYVLEMNKLKSCSFLCHIIFALWIKFYFIKLSFIFQ